MSLARAWRWFDREKGAWLGGALLAPGCVRYRPGMPTRTDAAIAAVLLVVAEVEVWRFGAGGGGWVAAICFALIALISAWRTRYPLASGFGVFVPAAVCAALASPPGSFTFAAVVVLGFYRIGTMHERRRANLALAASIVLALLITQPFSLNTFLAVVLTSFVVPWLIGSLRFRQQRAAAIERARSEAVELERARLARELHDLVSHSVGVIAVQAGAGDVLLDEHPERAREALHAIEATAREAMTELRRLLGLLREDGASALAPQPTLDQLDELVDRIRATGLDVHLHVEVDGAALDPATQLSVYRIVQEGLTNVLKHANASSVDVGVRRSGDRLEIEVSDNGRSASTTASSASGHGLAGIAERVSLLGGELEAGRDSGGFTLRALLPA